MPTYPLPTLAAQVIPAGISAPSYADIFASLQASIKSIYGADAYIDPDSQDGQLIAIVGKAASDCNDCLVADYRSFSPATAQYDALSSNVKINGIARAVSTFGSVLLRVSGNIGTQILNGVASDQQGNRWNLPGVVVIPPAGFADVTAVAAAAGAVAADVGTVTRIVTPQLGWQAVTNLAAAAQGAPVESDAALRQRQTYSTALPSQTPLDAMVGAVAAVPGVTQVRGYDNDTDFTDANGQSPHSIAIVTIGGAAAAIAQAMLFKKTPGGFTFGSTAQTATGTTGIPYVMRFSYSTPVRLVMAVTVKGYAGYTTTIGNQIKQSLADYVNGLGIGRRSDLGRLYLPAQLYDATGKANPFDVDVLQQGIYPAAPTAADVPIAFNANATLSVADITLTVT